MIIQKLFKKLLISVQVSLIMCVFLFIIMSFIEPKSPYLNFGGVLILYCYINPFVILVMFLRFLWLVVGLKSRNIE